MPQFAMTIDGAPVGAAGTFDVADPATGELFAQAPAAPPAGGSTTRWRPRTGVRRLASERAPARDALQRINAGAMTA